MMTKLEKYSNFITSNWAGGTTTELMIYPEGAVYKKLDFLFRLSTATVTDPKGTFTLLPGIKRKLLLLDGTIRLTHEYQKAGEVKEKQDEDFFSDDSAKKASGFQWMKPGDVACFPGWIPTESEGTGVDFNLMMSSCADGEIALITLLAGEKENYAEYVTSLKNDTRENHTQDNDTQDNDKQDNDTQDNDTLSNNILSNDMQSKTSQNKKQHADSGYCVAVYVTKGEVCLRSGEDKICLQKGELGVLLTDLSQQILGYQLKNESNANVQFVKCNLFW